MEKTQELNFLNQKLKEAKLQNDEDAIKYYMANISRINQPQKVNLDPKIIYTKRKGLSKIEKLSNGNIRLTSDYLSFTPKISNTKLRILVEDLQFDLVLFDLGKKTKLNNIQEILHNVKTPLDEKELVEFLSQIYQLGETGKILVEQIEKVKKNKQNNLKNENIQEDIRRMFRNEINKIKFDHEILFKNNNFTTDNVNDIIRRYKKCYNAIESSETLIPKEEIDAYLKEIDTLISKLDNTYEEVETSVKSF